MRVVLWEGDVFFYLALQLFLWAHTVCTLFPFGFTFPPHPCWPQTRAVAGVLRAQRNYLAAQHPEQLQKPVLLSNSFVDLARETRVSSLYPPEMKTDVLNNPP